MAHYPLISRIYIAAVITTSAAMTAGLLLLHWAELLDDAGMIAILGLAAGGTEFFSIRLRRANSITVTTVLYVFAIATLAPPAAITVTAIAAVAMAAATYRVLQDGSAHRLFSITVTLEEQTIQALVAMSDIIDQRDRYTFDHCKHVAEWAERIGRELKLPDEEVEVITLAARLHDIGKIGLSNEVLDKPGALDTGEWADVRKHPELGERILRFFPSFDAGRSYIKHHHERYDGTGYPEGLRGQSIPLGARVLCVADCLAAMLDRRPYKGALNIYLTMAELRRHSAKQFDPVVVAATLKMLDKDESSIQPAVGPDPDSMADVAELPQAAAEQRSTQLTATEGR